MRLLVTRPEPDGERGRLTVREPLVHDDTRSFGQVQHVAHPERVMSQDDDDLMALSAVLVDECFETLEFGGFIFRRWNGELLAGGGSGHGLGHGQLLSKKEVGAGVPAPVKLSMG